MADIKDEVRRRYGKVAVSESGCCGGGASGCGCSSDGGSVALSAAGANADSLGEISSMMVESYDSLQGHEPDADLSLGCGIPTRLAQLQQGETVIDLGSGAGNDAFVARHAVGDGGRVIGLDMTEEMVARARSIAEKRGFSNVDFVLGDIEAMPIDDETADIVLSNCTLNLVPDKATAFTEMFRVTRPGGRFCISDVVTEGTLAEHIRGSVESYVGCVAGALERGEYLGLLERAGFTDIAVREEREIVLPESIEADRKADRTDDGARVLSITVTGRR